MFLVNSVGVYRIGRIASIVLYIETMGGVVPDRNDLSAGFMMNFWQRCHILFLIVLI